VRTRKIGRSELEVSVLGLGCNNLGGRLDEDASIRVVNAAVDMGITMFDVADVYPRGKAGAAEELLGRALGPRRKQIVLATKFGIPMDQSGTRQGAKRDYIARAVEDSLKRLGTDWIDLYQLHAPDHDTPIEETLRALDDLIKSGKVRHIGCSNFAAWDMVDSLWIAKELGTHAFISVQNEYSLVNREPDREVIPASLKHSIGFLPFFPLASGLLTGKYRQNEPPPAGARLSYNKLLGDRFLNESNGEIVAALQAFCDRKGYRMLDLAFSWLLHCPAVSSVIAGASTPEQLAQNVKAVELALTPEDIAEIDVITGADRYKPSHG
jgi:aryl-alcohol dehydrogenase-like predicted oxidoreductase